MFQMKTCVLDACCVFSRPSRKGVRNSPSQPKQGRSLESDRGKQWTPLCVWVSFSPSHFKTVLLMICKSYNRKVST